MKRIIKHTAIGLALLVSFSACNDFLDHQPLSERVEDNFYRTPSDAREALFPFMRSQAGKPATDTIRLIWYPTSFRMMPTPEAQAPVTSRT